MPTRYGRPDAIKRTSPHRHPPVYRSGCRSSIGSTVPDVTWSRALRAGPGRREFHLRTGLAGERPLPLVAEARNDVAEALPVGLAHHERVFETDAIDTPAAAPGSKRPST